MYFKTPARFGQLRFDYLALTEASMPNAHFGILETTLAFFNRSSQAMALKLVPMSTSSQNTGVVQLVTIPAGARKQVVVPMSIGAEGVHLNGIAVYRGSDLMAVVRRNYHIPLLTTEVQDRLAYAQMLSRAQSQSESFRRNMVTQIEVLETLLHDVVQVKKQYRQSDSSRLAAGEPWSELLTRFENVNVPKPPKRPRKSVWK